MRRATRWGILAALTAAAVAIAALAGTTGSHAAPAAKKNGRHRLGLRQGGQHGAVRRSGPRCGQDPRQADQRQEQEVPLCDQDLRHAEQRRRQGEGLRAEPARTAREHHLHDLRRRLRDAGRPGGDQPRQARGRSLHRHRPDGAEALRQEGQARLQLRQRRAGRGLGDGRVRLEQALEDGGPGDEHAARLLQERRAGVRHPLPRARRQGRRPRELPDREQRRGHRRHAPQLAQGGRLRDLDRRSASCRRSSPASARCTTRRRS